MVCYWLPFTVKKPTVTYVKCSSSFAVSSSKNYMQHIIFFNKQAVSEQHQELTLEQKSFKENMQFLRFSQDAMHACMHVWFPADRFPIWKKVVPGFFYFDVSRLCAECHSFVIKT